MYGQPSKGKYMAIVTRGIEGGLGTRIELEPTTQFQIRGKGLGIMLGFSAYLLFFCLIREAAK